ncbi:NupC/NupG family nucleoside CNT transporter [Vibrio japonicus]|uniref:NupC/NupG family nucleoside CNT transporter n=1 Tax=Vibrio japonicus TaxID=1824638 RepID=A0ABY5LNB3_9VIBR|nr:nucleoside transporter C-terminal domain-containing protein [Vibrio japonicus]UUM32391.1 NupC/NupG family nucleoside CNT transporter [Vibrio japonicus]
MDFIRGFSAIVIFLFIAYLLSTDRSAINKRTTFIALGVQISLALLILAFPPGRAALAAVASGVASILHFGKSGVNFLFGGMLQGEGIGFVFAFQALPIIIFFCSLLSILYYFGIMQTIIRILGGAVQKVMGVSKLEATVSSANIFASMSQSTLLAKPYLRKLTRSEMFTVITVGLASVGGDVLAGYNMMGIPMEYLLACIFMGVPSGLLMAKIFMPETETVQYNINDAFSNEDKPASFIAAAADGAKQGMTIYLAVFAMLMAFISLIAMVNGFLGTVGGWVGVPTLSFEMITGFIFAPIAWLIGVDWQDAAQVGSLIGTKVIVNEFVAYSQLAPMLGTGLLAAKSEVIAIFALCGFANIGSVAILFGVIGELAPKRYNEVIRFGFRALLAATLANLLNATVANLVLTAIA